MSRVVVIGATGHIGTYLVPRLVLAGHEVVAVSRGTREAYLPHPAWSSVGTVTMDIEAEDKAGTFGASIAALNPDIVIHNLCFTVDNARQLVEGLRGKVKHLLVTCTIYVHGPGAEVPTTEMEPRRPLTTTPVLGEYSRQKALIEAYLLDEARQHAFPVTVIHPAHIVGRGWTPINPAATFHPEIFGIFARGEPFALPNLGLETVHVIHADDLAQVYLRAIDQWGSAVGQAFHAAAANALTFRGYAEATYRWFGQNSNLSFKTWEEWKADYSEPDWQQSYEGFARSSHSSIEKARRVLGFEPRYGSLEGIFESVEWLVDNGVVDTA